MKWNYKVVYYTSTGANPWFANGGGEGWGMQKINMCAHRSSWARSWGEGPDYGWGEGPALIGGLEAVGFRWFLTLSEPYFEALYKRNDQNLGGGGACMSCPPPRSATDLQ